MILVHEGLLKAVELFNSGRFAEFTDAFALTLDFLIHLTLVIIVPRQRRINLSEREMRMVFLDSICAPAVSHMIEHNFDHLHVGIVHPGAAVLVQFDMWNQCRCRHGAKIIYS